MKNCNEIMRGERAELSKKNPYYISKHRYYELKHFCRQYDEWKRALVRIDGWKAFPESTGAIRQSKWRWHEHSIRVGSICWSTAWANWNQQSHLIFCAA